MILRVLSQKETKLIEYLIRKAKLKIDPNWKVNIVAGEMSDGRMGSLKLFPENTQNGERDYIPQSVSECEFYDVDGVQVIASLFLDIHGNLYELDIWKVDFSELISLPDL